MSLLLAGLVFAGTSGALYLGRWIARRRVEEAGEEKEDKPDDDETRARAELDKELPDAHDDSDVEPEKESKKPAAPPAPKRRQNKLPNGANDRLDGFVCQLGDVLMRVTGEEAWLAGGVVLSEEVPIGVLFVAPDAGHDCAIYTRSQQKSVLWLAPLDPQAILVGGEPPSSVEQGGIRFDRARRLPLRPRRIGVGAPDLGDAVTVAEYVSAGAERLIVMKANSGDVRAYRGLELEAGSFEVIASGESTLD